MYLKIFYWDELYMDYLKANQQLVSVKEKATFTQSMMCLYGKILYCF